MQLVIYAIFCANARAKSVDAYEGSRASLSGLFRIDRNLLRHECKREAFMHSQSTWNNSSLGNTSERNVTFSSHILMCDAIYSTCAD